MKQPNLFEKAVAMNLSVSRFGRTKQGDKSEIKSGAEKGRLSLGVKLLLNNPEFDAVGAHLLSVAAWVKARSSPSFFRGGLFLFRLDAVPQVEEFMSASTDTLTGLLDDAGAVYAAAIEEDKAKLAGQFRASNYPDFFEVRAAYSIRWNWISLAVPDNLPPEVREIAKAKAEKMWQDAAEEIRVSLRHSFKGLVDWAAEKLKPDTDGGKKSFHASSIAKMQEFLKCFELRNITDDSELLALVEKSRKVFGDVGDAAARAEAIRESKDLQMELGDGFAAIKTELDKLIVETPSRRFNFSGE